MLTSLHTPNPNPCVQLDQAPSHWAESSTGLQHLLPEARESLGYGMEGGWLTPRALDSVMKNLCMGPTVEGILLGIILWTGCVAIGPFVGSAGKAPLIEFLGVVISPSKLLKIKQIINWEEREWDFSLLSYATPLNTFLCIFSMDVIEGRHGLFLATLDLRPGLLPCSKIGSTGGISGEDIRTQGLQPVFSTTTSGAYFIFVENAMPTYLRVVFVSHPWMLFLMV